MNHGDTFDGHYDADEIPRVRGARSLRGPEDERGRRRERRYLAVFLTFCGVVCGVLAVVKFVNHNVSGLVIAIFAAGLLRFSWSLWNRKD